RRERDEHRVGPMERPEEQAADRRCRIGVRDSTEQAVHSHGLQGHLLQDAEGKIADKMPRIEEMGGRTGKRAERGSGDQQAGYENQEYRCSAASGWPEVVGAPAERFGRVAMKGKAQNHPNWKNRPGLRL